VNEERQYMIRKSGYWYRPNASGYTSVPADAGLFNIDEVSLCIKDNKEVSYIAQADFLKEEFLPSLQLAQAASCTCQTMSPEITYHSPACMYRLLEESHRIIEKGLVQDK